MLRNRLEMILSEKYRWILLMFLLSNGLVYSRKKVFYIGGIFDSSEAAKETAFRWAVDYVNTRHNDPPLSFKAIAVKYDKHNGLSLTKKTCSLLSRGVHTVIGPSSPSMSRHVSAICSRKDVTQLQTRSYSEYEKHSYFTLNLHPHPPIVQKIFVDILRELDWHEFMIIYQDDESLQKMHLLFHFKSSTYDIKLRQLALDGRGSYRLMLNAIKKGGETHFVVVCDLETLKQFLQQAQQVGLLSEKHHYVIYNFDMSNVDLEPYQYGGCEILSVRFVNIHDAKVMRATAALNLQSDHYNETYLPQNTLNLEIALTMDAVFLIHKNLEERRSTSYTQEQNLNCSDSDSWYHGTSFLNDMNMVTIDGLSGTIKFDSQGYRSEFEAEIIELTTEGLLKIGTWNTSGGLDIRRKPVEREVNLDPESLRDRHFVVITPLTRPYGLLKDTTKQLYGNDRFEGYGVDLIQELSEMLGFNFTIIVQEDGANGNKDEKTGKWGGMIGQVRDGVADLAIGDLTITSEREEAVDFTHPFMTLGISILYRKPEPVPPSLFMFASPFSPQVWLLLVVAYISVSLSLFIMSRLSPDEWQNPYPCIEEPEYLINQFNFRNSFWFTVGSLMQQGTELAPIGISTRMLAGVWWFFTLIIVSSYTANLAAFLTVTTLKTPFTNIEELAKQTEIKYGAKSNGATVAFFRDSYISDYKAIYKYMHDNPDVMVPDNLLGVDRVEKENYAFLMESTSIEYVTERHCALAQIGAQLDEKGYGIAMKKGQGYRAALNTAILKLQETGRLTELKIKWWKEKLGGGRCLQRSSAATVTPLDLKNVGGVFLVLGVGTFLGISLAFVELSLDIFGYIRREKAKYKKEMKEEMKFFLKFKKNVKPARKIGQTHEDGVEFSFNNINYLENYINENNQNG